MNNFYLYTASAHGHNTPTSRKNGVAGDVFSVSVSLHPAL